MEYKADFELGGENGKIKVEVKNNKHLLGFVAVSIWKPQRE